MDYAAVDTSGPTISFASDVAPLLQANCSLPTCHKQGTAVGGFDTGPTVRDAPVLAQLEIDALHQRLFATPFATPTVPYVAASVPGESFLMLKLDGCHDSVGLDCSALGGTCGNQMPRNADPLEEEKRALVRIWIAQGAENN